MKLPEICRKEPSEKVILLTFPFFPSYGNPLIILHLYLIHLNPGIMVLAIIGISLQGTYLADPQAQTPEMEVHAAKMIREQMQLTQHFFADLR